MQPRFNPTGRPNRRDVAARPAPDHHQVVCVHEEVPCNVTAVPTRLYSSGSRAFKHPGRKGMALRQDSSSIRAGVSMHSLMRRRNVTASRPSTMR